MIFYSLWARTFLKADQDHHASTGQQPRWTQAGGALGGKFKGKSKRKNKKKKQECDDGADQGEDKSFGGAGFERKGGRGKRGAAPKVGSQMQFVRVDPRPSPGGPALDGQVPITER